MALSNFKIARLAVARLQVLSKPNTSALYQLTELLATKHGVRLNEGSDGMSEAFEQTKEDLFYFYKPQALKDAELELRKIRGRLDSIADKLVNENSEVFDKLCRRLNLTPSTRSIIEQIGYRVSHL